MIRKATIHGLVAIAIGLVLSASQSSAGSAPKGKGEELKNLVTGYLAPGATPKQAVITLWMSNVNPVGAISLPFKFAAPDSFWVDSIATRPYRAGSFMMPAPLYKRELQTLLVNMLRDSDSVKAKTGLVPPGQGTLAVIYLSAAGPFPLDSLKMAAVKLPPENVLMYVTDTFNSVQPDFQLVRGAPPTTSASRKGGGKTQ
jgi:hypothetical protein